MLRLNGYIRKKRILRRIAAVSLFLIAIELFCPALCDVTAFAVDAGTAAAGSSFETETPETNLHASNCPGEDSSDPVCNDECLCHAVAVPSHVDNYERASVTRDRAGLFFTHRIFNSLPPPYIPPKFS